MSAELKDKDGNPCMLRYKQRGDEVYDAEKVALMMEDPPPQPPGRKLEDIPLFMRKKMPLNFPDNRHLPLPKDAVPEVFKGTAVRTCGFRYIQLETNIYVTCEKRSLRDLRRKETIISGRGNGGTLASHTSRPSSSGQKMINLWKHCG